MCALCALRTSSSFADERLYLLELTSDLNFELRIQLNISFILILVEGKIWWKAGAALAPINQNNKVRLFLDRRSQLRDL